MMVAPDRRAEKNEQAELMANESQQPPTRETYLPDPEGVDRRGIVTLPIARLNPDGSLREGTLGIGVVVARKVPADEETIFYLDDEGFTHTRRENALDAINSTGEKRGSSSY